MIVTSTNKNKSGLIKNVMCIFMAKRQIYMNIH